MAWYNLTSAGWVMKGLITILGRSSCFILCHRVESPRQVQKSNFMAQIVKPSVKDFVSEQHNMTLKLPDFSNLKEWDSQLHDFPGFPMTVGNVVCILGSCPH